MTAADDKKAKDAAEAEAKKIVDDAKAEAKEITDKAKAEADKIKQDAQTEAEESESAASDDKDLTDELNDLWVKINDLPDLDAKNTMLDQLTSIQLAYVENYR